jgi:hypothetical protein
MLGERRYSSYSFTISALDGGEWSASRPDRALAPGKGPPVLIVQEAGWAPDPVGTKRLQEKSFRLCRGSNLDRSVVQSVTRHYIDWTTRFTQINKIESFNEPIVALMMEAVSTYETSSNFCETTRHNIPEDSLVCTPFVSRYSVLCP